MPCRAAAGARASRSATSCRAQTVEVVLRLSFPYGELGREAGLIVGLTDRDGRFAGSAAGAAEPARLSWTYADDRANDAQPRDPMVDRAVAMVFAARARQEAVASNRGGDYERASRVMAATARRIRSYAGKDAELRELAGVLEAEQHVYAAPMAGVAAQAGALRERQRPAQPRRDGALPARGLITHGEGLSGPSRRV